MSLSYRRRPETVFQNPISPGLHPIPGDCPLCEQPQFTGVKALGGEIEDMELSDGAWTVAHTQCILTRDCHSSEGCDHDTDQGCMTY